MRSDLKECLNDLFREWQLYHGAAGATFVRDGIIGSERDWNAAEPRILFLLKDANDKDGSMTACGFDLCRLWREPQRFTQHRKTVERRVAEWASDIRRAVGHSAPDLRTALLQSAVMNVKKLAGGNRSDRKDLGEAAAKEATFIKRQIELLNPPIIICGRTFDPVRKAWGGFHELEPFCLRRDRRLWFDHYHPACRPKHRHLLMLRHEQILKALLRHY